MKPPLLAVEAGDLLSQHWQLAVSAALIARRAHCSSSPAAAVLFEVKLFFAKGRDLACTFASHTVSAIDGLKAYLLFSASFLLAANQLLPKLRLQNRGGW